MSTETSDVPVNNDNLREGTFSQVEQIFGNDKADLKDFLRLVDTDLTEITDELKLVAAEKSLDRYRAVRHNTLTSVRLFGLGTLDKLLDTGLGLLRTGRPEQIEVHIAETLTEIARFRKLLRKRI